MFLCRNTLSKVKTLSMCFPAMLWETATSLWYSLQVTTCGALLRNSSSLNGLPKKIDKMVQTMIWIPHKVLDWKYEKKEKSITITKYRRWRRRYLQRRRTWTLTPFSFSWRPDIINILRERSRAPPLLLLVSDPLPEMLLSLSLSVSPRCEVCRSVSLLRIV